MNALCIVGGVNGHDRVVVDIRFESATAGNETLRKRVQWRELLCGP